MTIKFVEGNYKRDPELTPSLEFTESDGYYDCSICLNGIVVAYFDSTTGGINLIPFEVGPRFTDGGQIEEVRELEKHGVQFDKKPHSWGHEDTWEYYRKVS